MAETAKKTKGPKAAPEKTSAASANAVDEYIAQFPPEIQKRLLSIRKVIKKAAPKAIEKISWSMPTFWQTENLIHYAAFKNHISIFPGAAGVEAFAGELEEYKNSKGTIQFPNSAPIPLDLVARITAFRVKQVEEK